MVRVSALKLGDWGSIPGRVIPKMGPNASLRHTSVMSRGVYLYIKLPHATETGDRLLAHGPHGSTVLGSN